MYRLRGRRELRGNNNSLDSSQYFPTVLGSSYSRGYTRYNMKHTLLTELF